MKKISEFICKHKYLVLIIGLLLFIPSIIGIKNTKINYDILVYLPEDIETMKGQDILKDDFNMGAFSISIIDNMSAKDALKLEEKIKKVKFVEKVYSLYDVVGTTIPLDMFPSNLQEKIVKGDSTLLLITFEEGTSHQKTLDAVKEIRKITKKSCHIAGMSAMVLDTMKVSDEEMTMYVIIAVILCFIVLTISLDSYFIPLLLLGNIGFAILYNMGSNIFLGEISYITKAISTILQLGVTMDFSIFLYHKYESAKGKYKNNNEAMENAICQTMTSVFGSSLTTIAGFLALCTMNLTLGKDIGIVMAKGVLFGLICVVTIFPALILIFDKTITKTQHKNLLPKFKGVQKFVVKHYKKIFIIFIILLLPAWYCQHKTEVYYKLDKSLPKTLASSIANTKLKEDFNISSPEVILVSKDLTNNKVNEMVEKIEKVKGIDFVLSYSKISDIGLPNDMIPNDIKSILESDHYKIIFLNSTYDIATKKLNKQIAEVNDIVKKYDKNAIIAGEGPLMKDMVEISDQDFKNVTIASTVVIFFLMLFVLKSASLPVILVSCIELAIFANMGIPYLTNTTIPFIASIVIGTIQLGATIDYAILMTTKYLEVRKTGKDKFESIKESLSSSVSSIVVSAMCFFAATFGVGVYSKLEMISSLCNLISRGALISMVTVILVLPSLLLVCDKLIINSTIGFKKGGKSNEK